ncbi:MAG: RDD family protein [Planctomycetes bacterium]|nr:RDD family protein [Planctomycetota bacterium]
MSAPPTLRVGTVENPRSVRTLLTPEGIALPVTLAGAGDRLLAIFVDALLIAAVLLVLVVVAIFLPSKLGAPVVILGIFACGFVYFPWAELRWQGRTIGKRVAQLRVIDRAGGRLTARAIVVRNLTREVEMLLPLVVAFSGDRLIEDAPGWVGVASFAWIVVMGAIPLLNKDRQRIGDLLAGTVVVHSPKAALLVDLSDVAQRDGPSAVAAAAEYSFSAEQLGHYGEYELEVLADVLRSDRSDRRQALGAICEQVRKKIGWPGDQGVDPHRFLLAFYAAQRAHLEQRLLFGKRKRSKRG